jgi:hypothetical protein
MKTSKLKEADILEVRINVMESCAALAFGKVKQMPKHEFTTHLSGLTESGIFLPYSLRCIVFVRECDDMMTEISQMRTSQEYDQPLQDLVMAIAPWTELPVEISELRLSTHILLAGMEDDLNVKKSKNGMSKEEFDATFKGETQVRELQLTSNFKHKCCLLLLFV